MKTHLQNIVDILAEPIALFTRIMWKDVLSSKLAFNFEKPHFLGINLTNPTAERMINIAFAKNSSAVLP